MQYMTRKIYRAMLDLCILRTSFWGGALQLFLFRLRFEHQHKKDGASMEIFLAFGPTLLAAIVTVLLQKHFQKRDQYMNSTTEFKITFSRRCHDDEQT